MKHLEDLPVLERREVLHPTSCRPLRDAKEAIAFAISRFHESWSSYRSITPTLYLLSDHTPGVYLTLGRLRKDYRLDWSMIDAAVEALSEVRDARGFLVAGAGVGGSPPVPLFSLQGHEGGERHYGALDLGSLQPFEQSFVTELDLDPVSWEELWSEAASNANLS